MYHRRPSRIQIAAITGTLLLGAVTIVPVRAALVHDEVPGTITVDNTNVTNTLLSTSITPTVVAWSGMLDLTIHSHATWVPPRDPAPDATPSPKDPNGGPPPSCRPQPVLAHDGQVLSAVQAGGIPAPGPFILNTFYATNTTATKETIIEAGSDKFSHTQGVLIVMISDTCATAEGGGTYYTANKVGPLTLTSVQGNIVSFTYPGGSGTFDLETHLFANNL